jgi:hypothetical protein
MGSKLKRKNERPDGNRTMFYFGIALVIVSVSLLLGNFIGDSTLPAFMGLLGVISMGASKFRLLK